MGRKIPGKKHRGIKDPEKQQQERLNRIKDKINAPPSNPREQEIPESLRRIIQLKEQVKLEEAKAKKKSILKKPVKRLKKPKQVIPGLQRYVGEKDGSFLYRVGQVVNEVIKEAHFEEKYNVEIKKNKLTGEVEDVVKRPKDEVEEMLKKARQNTQNKRKRKKRNESRLTKTQKREQKLKLKREKKILSKTDEFDKFKDDVKFGDVVHSPPSLVAPKKITKSNKAQRPGSKDLILKSVLNTNQSTTKSDRNVQPVVLKKKELVEVDKKSKRKSLPVALRRQLEKERTEVVKAYRLLKTTKNNMILV